MKSFLRALLLPSLLMGSLVVQAGVGDSFQADSLYYTIISETECELSQGWKSDYTDFKIPSSVTHEDITYTVSAIGENAFSFRSRLESCELPNTITKIGEKAFSSTALSKINLPESLISIGQGAFSGCQLTEITIPKGITVIEPYVFSGNNNLAKVSIPEGVVTIKNGAFASTGIQKIGCPI